MDNLQILFSAPIFTLQLLIDGILIGAIFALAAYGMAMVWGVMKIINFAQGEFVILGGFFLFSLTRIVSYRSWPPSVSPSCCSSS
jgi:branched-chain amino acid transport system permease protein